MHLFIILLLYNSVQLIALPFFFIYLFIRKLNNKPVVGNVWERCGFLAFSPRNKHVIWLHAVSVGEVLSLAAIIKKIKTEIPDAYCYVTTGTVAGKKMVLESLDASSVSFMPFDFLLPMLLAFWRIQPSRLVIVESELWPNVFCIASFFKVPIYLLNARISKRSHGRLKMLRWFFSPLLRTCSHIYLQHEADVAKFCNFGIKREDLSFIGSSKVLSVQQRLEQSLQTPKTIVERKKDEIILLAGSIHPLEETIYLDLFAKLKPHYPTLKLILAPRHFHWKEKLTQQAQATGYTIDAWDTPPSSPRPLADITLIFTLGILFDLYQYADIFFLGGTFVPVGGHNILEPAVWGVFSLVGPYHHSVEESVKQLAHTGALHISLKQENVLKIMHERLHNLEHTHALGQKGKSLLSNEYSSVLAGCTHLLNQLKHP